MALEIEWTKRADKKFDTILVYLNEEWGERVTGNFVKKVYEFQDILVEYPEIGTLEHKQKGVRGFTIVKQMSIFYKVSGNKIILLDFFDTRQNPKKKRF
jgi:plasmid stabilization system protein ParE